MIRSLPTIPIAGLFPQADSRPRRSLQVFPDSRALHAGPRLAAAVYRKAVIEALRRHQLGVAAALVNTRHGCTGFFRFDLYDGELNQFSVVGLEFSPGCCALAINRHLLSHRLEFVVTRLLATLLLLVTCRDVPSGRTWLNLDDFGTVPGLAFSEASADYRLIPDPIYLAARGYRNTARHYLTHDIPWADRRKVAFWRGTTTGPRLDDDWRALDRVRLCELSSRDRDTFDVGFTDVVQMNAADSAAVRASGLMRQFVPETKFIHYRYQIDIDGNTNSWPGLFLKLLTGSPVLKVDSRFGFRQWYYNRLKPWENFVPVKSDLSDLLENLTWLVEHDDDAQRIGAAGRALARSMTFPAEIAVGRETLLTALS